MRLAGPSLTSRGNSSRKVGVRLLSSLTSCVALVCFVRFRAIRFPFQGKNVRSNSNRLWGGCQAHGVSLVCQRFRASPRPQKGPALHPPLAKTGDEALGFL